jgi:phage shock protein PspC (stress-responsive transcriptional regulator)
MNGVRSHLVGGVCPGIIERFGLDSPWLFPWLYP